MVNLSNNNRQWDKKLAPKAVATLPPFHINGKEYTHIDNTESFASTIPGDPETMTARELLSIVLPSLYREKYRRVNPPPAFFEFNQSGRNKLLRCAQNYHDPAIPSPETDRFIEFFNVLSDQPDCWNVQTQFSAAKFAAKDLPPISCDNLSVDSLAAAQCIQYGWAQKHPTPNTKCFMYTIDIRSEHALISILPNRTFQDRVISACSAALQAYSEMSARTTNSKEITAEVQKRAIKTLYYENGVWISTTSDYNNYLRGILVDFIDVTLNNALQTGDFDPLSDYPEVEEPEEIYPPGQLTIKWCDFVFEGTKRYLAPRAANDIANTAAEVLGDFSEGDLLTTEELLELGLSRNQITNWAKYGVLKLAHKIGRQNAYYIFGPPPRRIKNILKSEPITLMSMNARLSKQLNLEDLRIRTAEAANPDAVKYNMMVMETRARGRPIRDAHLKPGSISTVAADQPDIKPTVAMFKPAVPKRPKFQSKISKKGVD